MRNPVVRLKQSHVIKAIQVLQALSIFKLKRLVDDSSTRIGEGNVYMDSNYYGLYSDLFSLWQSLSRACCQGEVASQV